MAAFISNRSLKLSQMMYGCNKQIFMPMLSSKLYLNSDTNPLFQKQTSTSSNQRFLLSFDEYQNLKRTLRTKQRVAAIPFAFLGITTASFSMAYLYPDMFDATPENVQLIMGLDPLVFSGVSGVVAAGIGYVVGTNIFKFFWKKLNKQQSKSLEKRDADFLLRLDKHRFGADSKFEDDYYGETIKNLSDYRQWIRTQQRKRENHMKFQMKSDSENNPE